MFPIPISPTPPMFPIPIPPTPTPMFPIPILPTPTPILPIPIPCTPTPMFPIPIPILPTPTPILPIPIPCTPTPMFPIPIPPTPILMFPIPIPPTAIPILPTPTPIFPIPIPRTPTPIFPIPIPPTPILMFPIPIPPTAIPIFPIPILPTPTPIFPIPIPCTPTPYEELTAATDKVDDLIEAKEFDPADLIGKVLAFINQVHSSPQAHAYFVKLCKDNGLPELQLIKWAHTHWASLYDLITHLLEVCSACTKFMVLANEDDRVPNLKPLKMYIMFRLSKGEWHMLELIHNTLMEPAMACQTFLHTAQPTMYLAFPVIEFMQQKWEVMAAKPAYASIATALYAGLNNLHKWYWTRGQQHVLHLLSS
ncbi:hypothetical protein EDB83DRAFT_2531746 [Lactarius deliciosus]|nr:hypothetical protein EDB83DRAFT_2531746 [Lactarius deliciosus]